MKVARGRFARICVKIDVNQLVVRKLGVSVQWYNFQYEGLHTIRAQCGCYGHVLKGCKVAPPVVAPADADDAGHVESPSVRDSPFDNSQAGNMTSDAKVGEVFPDFLHGDWLVLTRKKRTNRNAINVGQKIKGAC